jgi:hypothetical protein
MLTIEGPKLMGYETHFNSAATQALLPLLPQGTSLFDIMQACINGHCSIYLSTGSENHL